MNTLLLRTCRQYGGPSRELGIQNADLILAVGTRISIRQVGYNWKTWARAAEVIMVDIDPAEMKSLPFMWRCPSGRMPKTS